MPARSVTAGRFVAIHGHFYQPPRENPWLEAVEVQDSAAPYNDLILPLASRRDKVTQVRWGRRDFQERFERDPEGMWLPETAVDNESLEILADAGMKFTILAPHQARRIRRIGTDAWQEVNDR